jgi:hypothetical protein
MIIVSQQAPRSVLFTAILDAMRKYPPTGTEHAIILLPLLHDAIINTSRKTFQPNTYRIAFDYQPIDINPISMAFLAGSILGDLCDLPGSIRVPYTLFIYSDEFRRAHRDALELGNAAYRLVCKLGTVHG